MPDTATPTRIEQLEAGEKQLLFPHFTADDAWALGSTIRAHASRDELPLSICIRRANGSLLFQASLPGSTADNNDWADRKAAVSLRFEESSALFGERYASVQDIPLLAQWVDLSRYAPVGGAFPIMVTGTGVVAAVAVSGLPGNGDHELLQSVLTEHLGL